MNQPSKKTPRTKSKRSKPSESAQTVAQPEASFEDALSALEAVVRDLEQGDLGLSQALSRYEEGVRHLKQCYRQLEAAERRIELLKEVDAQGHAVAEPFDEEAMSLEEKAANRGSRRSARNSPQGSRRSAEGGGMDGSATLF